MQRNEFEKQMRQRMDDLKIHPSESVWLNVEAGITKTKRRKWAWMFFPLFIGLLWGGYFLWQPDLHWPDNSSRNLAKNGVPEKNTPFKSAKLLKNPTPIKDILVKSQKNESPQANTLRKKQNEKQSSLPATKKTIYKSALVAANNSKIFKPGILLKQLQTYNGANTKSAKIYRVSNQPEIKSITAEDLQNNENVKQETEIISTQKNEVDNTLAKKGSALTQLKIDSISENEQVKTITAAAKKAKATQPASTKKIQNVGVIFSAGVSGIPKSFLGSLDKNYTTADALYAAPLNNGNSNSALLLPSKIESSAAFTVGVFAEKHISKNKMITIGLNYKQFSSTNKTGIKSDSLQRLTLSNPVYTYHNYYHFIEIPVSFKIQLSAKKIPIFWDAGISLSQLIGSNALQFSNAAVVYHTQNSLFNKTQVGFNTAIVTALFSAKKTALLIGPYIYYGTTKIATEGLYKNQHFTFIGVRSQILFKK